MALWSIGVSRLVTFVTLPLACLHTTTGPPRGAAKCWLNHCPGVQDHVGWWGSSVQCGLHNFEPNFDIARDR